MYVRRRMEQETLIYNAHLLGTEHPHLLSAMAFCEIAFPRMLPESPRIIDRSITFAKSAANLAVYPFLALPSAADKKCLVEDVCDVVFEARVGISCTCRLSECFTVPRAQIVRFTLGRRCRSRTHSHSLVWIARGQSLTYDARTRALLCLVVPTYLARLKFNYSAVSAPIPFCNHAAFGFGVIDWAE